ncbi:anthranilate phosphoribosyltransferase [bacterium]|nr:anthranilate phosphoribosyltransferase [bacterium]
MIKEIIQKVVDGCDLTEDEARGTMEEIMDGKATASQIASFITALRIKGETVEEITGCAKVMREKAERIYVKNELDVVDTCGTGGDKADTFNVSTACAIVASGGGVVVAKHGNRSVSSKCGSADVMKEMGINIDIPPKKVEECINNIGIGFLFAPLFHKAMKYAIGPRREIGIRTIFNILGPLTNPANARYQILGVYDPNLTDKLANVLKNMGSKRAFVAYGEGGFDEISITGKTRISELKNGEIKTYFIEPRDFGLSTGKKEDIKGGDAAENAKIIIKILKGEKGARRDIVVLNSAHIFVATGKAKDIREGITLAENSIDSGAALNKLNALREETNKNF